MSAIHLFGKSGEFALRFVNLQKMDVINEIKSFPEANLSFRLNKFEKKKHLHDYGEYLVATSPRSIDNIISYIVIKKNSATQSIEDPEMIKTLAAQALFMFMFIRQKKQIQCVI
jgi:hypothetical protein